MFVVIDTHGGYRFSGVCEVLDRHGVPTQQLFGHEQAREYIHTHGLKNHVFLIHGSLGTSSNRFEIDETISQELIGIVQDIREKNVYAPIVLFSGASKFPLKRMITDLQADGYFSEIVRLEEFIALASRGEITPEEMNERGHSIENISYKRRETGVTSHYRRSIETSE